MQAGCELREAALRALETERLVRGEGRGRELPPTLQR